MKTSLYTLLFLLILTTIVALPRLFSLNQFTTADEKRWVANTANFTQSLALGKLDNLFQQAHPGITTQWLGAPAIYSSTWSTKKLPIVIGQILLLLATAYIFYRISGPGPSVVILLLLAINPVLIAHTRTYAMDSLLAIFLISSLACLQLWRQQKNMRYLIFSGLVAAAAILSKLPGVFIIPVSLALLFWWALHDRHNLRQYLYALIIWGAAVLVGLVLILPSLFTNTGPVLQDMAAFFTSTDYVELHPAGRLYYARSFVFLSTPLVLLALILLPIAWKKINRNLRDVVFTSLLAALAFTIMMSVGLKKGDRYILPAFLWLDVAAGIILWQIIADFKKNMTSKIITVTIFLLFTWQTVGLFHLHPYYLAYINPLTKPWFGERRLGWGEGLDLAADYLNTKPSATTLKVASYYPVEFGEKFSGSAVPLHNWEEESINYAVLYRAQLERGAEAWETDVLMHFKNKQPEKIITINGLEYVWIYKLN